MWDTVIGLEIHVQLNTLSKAFSGDENKFLAEPNTNVSPISIALPGALPKVNEQQVHSAIKLGLALDSEINRNNAFDRKNYFYPDSPKGYQITQNAEPILRKGQFTFRTNKKEKTIRIHQVHMEDDAGKSIHDLNGDLTRIDLNRAGTPLLEVVTEPDFCSGQEVSDFLVAFQNLVRYLEISDANMEEGSLRCDCNVSVKPTGQTTLGTRCEIKNINSKKFAKTAIEYERDRQINLIESGKTVDQETRLFDSKQGVTFTMRKKEDALDYRYYPDPDLQNIIITEKQIEQLRQDIDWLPWTAEQTLIDKYQLQPAKASALSAQKETFIYFLTLQPDVPNNKLVSDFIINHIAPRFETIKRLDEPVTKDRWVELLSLINEKKISSSAGYQVLVPLIIEDPTIHVNELATTNNLFTEQVSATDLSSFCTQLISDNPGKAQAYKKGKKGLLGFFMGQAMRSGKKYPPTELQAELEKQLAE